MVDDEFDLDEENIGANGNGTGIETVVDREERKRNLQQKNREVKAELKKIDKLENGSKYNSIKENWADAVKELIGIYNETDQISERKEKLYDTVKKITFNKIDLYDIEIARKLNQVSSHAKSLRKTLDTLDDKLNSESKYNTGIDVEKEDYEMRARTNSKALKLLKDMKMEYEKDIASLKKEKQEVDPHNAEDIQYLDNEISDAKAELKDRKKEIEKLSMDLRKYDVKISNLNVGSKVLNVILDKGNQAHQYLASEIEIAKIYLKSKSIIGPELINSVEDIAYAADQTKILSKGENVVGGVISDAAQDIEEKLGEIQFQQNKHDYLNDFERQSNNSQQKMDEHVDELIEKYS